MSFVLFLILASLKVSVTNIFEIFLIRNYSFAVVVVPTSASSVVKISPPSFSSLSWGFYSLLAESVVLSDVETLVSLEVCSITVGDVEDASR
jgi:hypothetical protein